MRTKIAILGSTGSIGIQTLDIVRANNELFEVIALVANNNWELLAEQAKEFCPKMVVIANDNFYKQITESLQYRNIEIYTGESAICDVASITDIDVVVTAMVGFSGLKPTIKAIENHKKIALANKETLVVAGELIMQLARKNNVKIYPIDSEHSAIYQCLLGDNKSLEKIILTASGGPFRTLTKEELTRVTKQQALSHPNWSMGNKVTIDSASLMNKGLEMIEACWLFNVSPSMVDVIIHPQSIIHSMVCYNDGSYKAQLGLPDMRLPISFAIGLSNRIESHWGRLNFAQIGNLTFENPDMDKFPNLKIAYIAMENGGSYTTVMNAANEIAVDAFLNDKISFIDITTVIEYTLAKYNHNSVSSIEDYFQIDNEARQIAINFIKHRL